MEKKVLFPKAGGFLHGGDYNPEQWLDHPEVLEEDIRLMKEACVNVVTLGVFSWSVYEPAEGEFRFEWLAERMDRLYENGIYTILATPSGARPAWLDEKYPEAMRVDGNGVRNRHGMRHNHCMTSPAFREKVKLMDRKLAEAVKGHPGLLLWHISNELGGECFCPLCREKFREYLSNKFEQNIDHLNKAWWTTFWSHRYNSFAQVEPPFSNGERSIPGLMLEWKRFTTENMTDFMKLERDILREVAPEIPCTTNFMKLYPNLDYHVMAKELDLISWDSYPAWDNDQESFADTAAGTSFDHAVMRSMKREKPFLLMESTPSLVNWHPYNRAKRPGMHLLSAMQAVACGSDSVQYFQWRKGRGSFEQYHGAVIGHNGRSDTRVFQDVAEVGDVLKRLAPVAGTTVHARAAILFDWPSRWAIADMTAASNEKKNYESTCFRQYRYLMELGIETDVISPFSDYSGYQVIIAPMLYLLAPEAARKLKAFVRTGGILAATYLTGWADENTLCFSGGFPGGGLGEVFGLYAEELDTLYPTQKNEAVFSDGSEFELKDYCEILKLDGAEALAVYGSDFYAGTPAVAKHIFGGGSAWYIGARMEADGMKKLYARMMEEAGIPLKELPAGIEYHQRIGEEGRYAFYLNHSGEERTVRIEETGTDLISGQVIDRRLAMKPYGAACIRLAHCLTHD